MKDNDKSKLIAIILVIVTIVVVVLSAIFDNKKEENKISEVSIVTNYSDFYTVDSCLYRTITYLSSNDKESLLFILSDKYKEANKIDENNVMNVFAKVEENSTFVSRKMYYQDISEDITKYYVYGYVEQNEIFDDFETNKLVSTDMYFIVYLDKSNKIFSIEPYSEDLFTKLGGDNNEG